MKSWKILILQRVFLCILDIGGILCENEILVCIFSCVYDVKSKFVRLPADSSAPCIWDPGDTVD